MSSLGSTMIALADDGRLFGLDYQLLFDASITAINVFILFILLSFILFNPVRNMLKKRQDKITSDRENAEADKKEALAMKQEYEAKLKAANKEAEGILSDARKVAKHNEEKIVADAKQEAARIIARANTEAELEKQKAADEVKQQIIAVARLMASKVVAESISEADSQALIEQTLNEMGDKTWLSYRQQNTVELYLSLLCRKDEWMSSIMKPESFLKSAQKMMRFQSF